MSREEHELPPYSGSPRQLDVLKATLSRLNAEYRLSQEKLAEKFRLFAVEAEKAGHRWHLPSIEQQLISKLLKPGGFGRTVYPDTYEAMWLWLSAEFEEVLKECDVANPRRVAARNPVVAAIHEQLSPGRSLVAEKINQLQGRYLAYRRFFLDPTRVMVAELHCGGERDRPSFGWR